MYDIKLGEVMSEVNAKEGKGKRIVNDVLKPLAIKSDKTLHELTKSLVFRRLKVHKLEVQVKIFQDQRSVLSREQTRREAEGRMV